MTADMEQIRQRLERFTVLIGESDKLPIWNAEYAVAAQELAAGFYGDDVPALLTALDAANARIAALESVVRELMGGSTCESDDEMNICIYCGHEIYEYYQEWNPMRIGRRELPHAPDCAWVAARQLVPPES